MKYLPLHFHFEQKHSGHYSTNRPLFQWTDVTTSQPKKLSSAQLSSAPAPESHISLIPFVILVFVSSRFSEMRVIEIEFSAHRRNHKQPRGAKAGSSSYFNSPQRPNPSFFLRFWGLFKAWTLPHSPFLLAMPFGSLSPSNPWATLPRI